MILEWPWAIHRSALSSAWEESEILSALGAPDKYFLVVISNIQGAGAHPKVRIIADPVRQLAVNHASAMTLSGIRDAEGSLVYNLAPTDR
jgi:hypothetical protein